jgi:TonB-dependent SusC/RagA subfamily outer membrane receptor
MKKKYYILLAFLCVVILFQSNGVFAQQARLITIESVIVDENGNPIENAEIFSGGAYTKTDANGKFTLLIEPGNKVVVEAKGYENTAVTIDEARNRTNISLKSARFLYGSDEMVDMAFRKVHEGNVVGAYSNVDGDKVNAYDNTIWAGDVLTGRTLGMLGSNSIRGIGIGIDVADETGSGLFSGNALFIVDGLPRDIESLRLSEIEDITVLKDVNSAILYGSAAVNGVILITTKRGEAFKKQSNISANYGISTPRALPEFLNSADYMTYYNLARTMMVRLRLSVPKISKITGRAMNTATQMLIIIPMNT